MSASNGRWLRLGRRREVDEVWGERLPIAGRCPPQRSGRSRRAIAIPAPPVPDWARAPAPVESRPPRPLAPSAILDENQSSPPPGAGTGARRPGAGACSTASSNGCRASTPAQRHNPALRWLEHSAGVADAASAIEFADAACAHHRRPGIRRAVRPSLACRSADRRHADDGRVVAGTVDRLLVEPSSFRVIDFKTGAGARRRRAMSRRAHRAQMQAYAEALRVIFPGRSVEAALLYTAGPKLIALAC